MRPHLPFRVRLLAATPLLALTLTACGGSSSSGDGIASAQTGAPAPAKSSSAEAGAGSSVQAELARYVADQRKFAQCLRSKGVDAEDPDSKGVVELPRDIKKDPQKLKTLETCPQGTLSLELVKYLSPKNSAKQIATDKAYARCMQENGAPDFPDYDDDGYQPLDAHYNSETPAAIQALTVCSDKIYHEKIDQHDPNAKG